MRLNSELCGIVSGVIEQVDTTTLFNQYQSWLEERMQNADADYQEWFEEFKEPKEEQFTAWFDGIKGKLKEDIATNLQLQISDLEPRVEKLEDELEGLGTLLDEINGEVV